MIVKQSFLPTSSQLVSFFLAGIQTQEFFDVKLSENDSRSTSIPLASKLVQATILHYPENPLVLLQVHEIL